MSSPHPPRTDIAYRHVARKIRLDIEAGRLRHGEALPSTRELAEQYGVSGYTISEAMRLLVEEGLIVTRARSKRVVHAPDQASRTELRPRTPHVILIGGYAGSGKSELGRILVRETGWPLLDKDTLTRPVVEAALEMTGNSPNDRDSDFYFERIRPREYEALTAATVENIECGNSAIVTAPFIREFGDEAWIKRTQALYASMNATTTLVWVYCDVDTMRTYLRHRGAARDATKLADWPAYVAKIDVDFRPPVPHILIDNSASSDPLPHQAKKLMSTILGGNAEG